MREVGLDESASATADVWGEAQVRLGPTRLRQRWRVANVALTSTATTETEARVYSGYPDPANFIAGTYSGNRDNAPISQELSPGAVLTVIWTGCAPGDRCTVSIQGTMQVP